MSLRIKPDLGARMTFFLNNFANNDIKPFSIKLAPSAEKMSTVCTLEKMSFKKNINVLLNALNALTWIGAVMFESAVESINDQSISFDKLELIKVLQANI